MILHIFYTLLIVYFLIILLHGYLKLNYEVHLWDRGYTKSRRVMLIPNIIVSRVKASKTETNWELIFAFLNKRYYFYIHSFKIKKHYGKQ